MKKIFIIFLSLISLIFYGCSSETPFTSLGISREEAYNLYEYNASPSGQNTFFVMKGDFCLVYKEVQENYFKQIDKILYSQEYEKKHPDDRFGLDGLTLLYEEETDEYPRKVYFTDGISIYLCQLELEDCQEIVYFINNNKKLKLKKG